MDELIQFMRRQILRYRLRSLEKQAELIVAARETAYQRLLEIERETTRLDNELWNHGMPNLHPALA